MRFAPVMLALLVLGGCSARQQPAVEPAPSGPMLHYEVAVPRCFQSDLRGWESEMSGCQRYLEGFERGWWSCVENYTANIDYQSSRGDYIANGWGGFIGGFAEGYRNAEQQIKSNLKAYGPGRTHEYLRDTTANIWEE